MGEIMVCFCEFITLKEVYQRGFYFFWEYVGFKYKQSRTFFNFVSFSMFKTELPG